MKKLLKRILGPLFISRLRMWYPSAVQKEIDKEEKKELLRRAEFYSMFIRKNDICFDVGANIGNRIGPLLHIGAKVIAVEPQEMCYNYLKKRFKGKIEVVSKGLGEEAGFKEFHLSDGPPLSSFSDDWIASVKDGRFKEYSWNKVVLVEMTTLDLLIGEYGLPVFIKIDVEGYELEVLRGLHSGVKMISFEYTVPEQKEKPLLCIDEIFANNKQIECNYSVAESMAFAIDRWLPAEEMKKYMLTDEFINTGFGDIYVRTVS